MEEEEPWKDLSLHYSAAAAYLQGYLAAPTRTALTYHAGATGSGDPLAFSFPDSNNNNRMIKHRASAARSRARQHAYTKELELELAQLRRDNAMLIKRQQDLHPRLVLQRCRSAPAP